MDKSQKIQRAVSDKYNNISVCLQCFEKLFLLSLYPGTFK